MAGAGAAAGGVGVWSWVLILILALVWTDAGTKGGICTLTGVCGEFGSGICCAGVDAGDGDASDTCDLCGDVGVRAGAEDGAGVWSWVSICWTGAWTDGVGCCGWSGAGICTLTEVCGEFGSGVCCAGVDAGDGDVAWTADDACEPVGGHGVFFLMVSHIFTSSPKR